ncbi:hypothetical protein BH11PLA2_BH11PLA2_29870 [soil metagenome]
MKPTGPPRVIVVDDHPDEQRPLFRGATGANFELVHPEEVEPGMLDEADLFLVDFVIDNWEAREKSRELGLKPKNGLALSAVLREHTHPEDRPTGFAIHTGKPEALWLTPAEPRRHLIARAYNLEWVFLKSEPQLVVRQAVVLAGAIQALPASWPGEDRAAAINNVQELLGLGSTTDHEPLAWLVPALTEVSHCRPPVTELSIRSHGLVFLRWMLHRILPYPCFLMDSYRLAARVRIDHESLQTALAGPLGMALQPYLYKGVLAEFAGERWWRAGVEDFLWDLSAGASVPAAELRGKLSEIATTKLLPAASDNLIVCVDQDYRTLAKMHRPEDVVRIRPDDWPPFASQAWTTVKMARESPKLAAVVVSEDQERLTDGTLTDLLTGEEK